MNNTNQEYPLVSVIIPAYNHADYIGQTLDSVMVDSYPHKEILIIDDGSTDNTDQMIRQWISEHTGVSVDYLSRPNRGLTPTLNELIKKANGQYVVYLASDDCLTADSIICRYQALQAHPDKLAVCGDAIVVDHQGQIIHQSGLSQMHRGRLDRLTDTRTLRAELLSRWCIPGTVLMAHRDLYERIGYYREDMTLDDHDMYLRMLAADTLCCIADPVLIYRLHGTNVSMPARDNSKAFFARRVRNNSDLARSIACNIHAFGWGDRLRLASEYIRYTYNVCKYTLKKMLAKH